MAAVRRRMGGMRCRWLPRRCTWVMPSSWAIAPSLLPRQPTQTRPIADVAGFDERTDRPPRITESTMKFLLMVYSDDALLDALPPGEFDTRMHACITHADELRAEGRLLDAQQLEAPATAKSVRTRLGKTVVLDGPFAETKEYLAGFNLVEADSVEEAVRMAAELPWAQTGCIEVRPLRDFDAVRR